ncbi:hypothetical protein RRG08_004019 [Elysia crispata]|uniref:Secreted protein n=1 Tax=Elysia crispata TaxID=231223 RepID=A0AAE0XED9_9GAST|nr:hypothetical protein RRG08_004019 [Elysia crispata]
MMFVRLVFLTAFLVQGETFKLRARKSPTNRNEKICYGTHWMNRERGCTIIILPKGGQSSVAAHLSLVVSVLVLQLILALYHQQLSSSTYDEKKMERVLTKLLPRRCLFMNLVCADKAQMLH